MVVNCYRHNLFGLILADNILIKFSLDLVRSRDVLDVKSRFYLALAFFLDLLRIWYAAHVETIVVVHVKESKSWESILILVKLIHEIWIVQKILIVKLAYSIHGLLHAVIADADVVWKVEHLASFALRTSADKADVFVFSFFFIIIRCIIRFIVRGS